MAQSPETISPENLALVRRLAVQMLGKLPANIEFDDLVQVGLMGLMQAKERFDPTKDAQFDTFATQRIKGSMLDELRAGDYLTRSVRRSQRAIEAAIQKLEHQLHRAPVEREVAREMGLTLQDFQNLRTRAFDTTLVHIEDIAVHEGDVDFFIDRRHADDESSPLRRLEDRRQREAVVASIGLLPERQRQVMSLYYEQDLSFGAIAEVMGISESRVCQLHAECLVKLRMRLREF